jgi:DNA-binding transcriptional ArsR family regulator
MTRNLETKSPYFDNTRNMVDGTKSPCNTTRMKLDDAAAHLEALGNPTRLKIYRTLVRAGDAGLPVGRLQDKLKIAPSTLSHHIKALMVVGLINQVRDATTLVCHANYDVMRGLVDFLVAECCTDVAEGKDTKTAA